jgi:hypothetical protein
MENLKDLEYSEMMHISGGTNVAYEIGYVLGSFVKKLTILKTLGSLL